MPRTPVLYLLTAALLFGSAWPRQAAAQVLPGTLPFFYDLYTFRGDANETAVVGAFAVPAGRLHRVKRNGLVEYELVVSLVLADTAAGTVSRMDDSVTIQLRRAPSADELVTAHLEVNAPPSGTTVQRVIMSDVKEPGFGQLYIRPFTVPDYSGSHLMLSDIALSDAEVEGTWKRGDVTLALLPTGRLPEGFFSLYYEIYNLPVGNTYATEITIERLEEPEEGRDPDVAEEVRIRFSGTSMAGPDSVVHELRRIESLLQRGTHRLTVLITDEESGQVARQARTFRIGK